MLRRFVNLIFLTDFTSLIICDWEEFGTEGEFGFVAVVAIVGGVGRGEDGVEDDIKCIINHPWQYFAQKLIRFFKTRVRIHFD